MRGRRKFLAIFISVAAFIGILAFYLQDRNFAVLNPKGTIAQQQLDLLIFGSLLSLIIVVPVFIMAFWFAWKYREDNPKRAKYQPDWDHDNRLEFIWWTVPLILIGILSVVTWRSSHALDPFRPIKADKPAMTIQVVALDWKWLFIYPKQEVASVNFVQFPEDTPVKFEITADAPMNSFWIPNLGGQMYAMTGMATHLNLMASEKGEYEGMSSNISGRGFADMRFTAKASSDQEFAEWVRQTKRYPMELDQNSYKSLAKPSVQKEPLYYSDVEPGLYNKIVMKYMGGHAGHGAAE